MALLFSMKTFKHLPHPILFHLPSRYYSSFVFLLPPVPLSLCLTRMPFPLPATPNTLPANVRESNQDNRATPTRATERIAAQNKNSNKTSDEKNMLGHGHAISQRRAHSQVCAPTPMTEEDPFNEKQKVVWPVSKSKDFLRKREAINYLQAKWKYKQCGSVLICEQRRNMSYTPLHEFWTVYSDDEVSTNTDTVQLHRLAQSLDISEICTSQNLKDNTENVSSETRHQVYNCLHDGIQISNTTTPTGRATTTEYEGIDEKALLPIVVGEHPSSLFIRNAETEPQRWVMHYEGRETNTMPDLDGNVIGTLALNPHDAWLMNSETPNTQHEVSSSPLHNNNDIPSFSSPTARRERKVSFTLGTQFIPGDARRNI